MLTWGDMAVVNAIALAAFCFYAIGAIRYGVQRNWKLSLTMMLFSTVPWLVLIGLMKFCHVYCADFTGVWITLAVMKLAFWLSCGALITCAQLLPIRHLAVPSLIFGALVFCVGAGFTIVEFMQRLNS